MTPAERRRRDTHRALRVARRRVNNARSLLQQRERELAAAHHAHEAALAEPTGAR